tara:strand:+ start:207 stop:497 length:291 start_codon:yes stop_codon:yes gene_type:complete
MKQFSVILSVLLGVILFGLLYKYHKHNAAMFEVNLSMKRNFMLFVVVVIFVLSRLVGSMVYVDRIGKRPGKRGLRGSNGSRGHRGKNAYCRKDLKK